jgi:AcrR family transcriptional regulator
MASKIRDRIVLASIRRFASNGYHGTSTKDIAVFANVTEGSLFRLFRSKEQLFTEALSVALTRDGIRRMHLRVAAFALLEAKGLTESNLKALRRLGKKYPLITELLKECPRSPLRRSDRYEK